MIRSTACALLLSLALATPVVAATVADSDWDLVNAAIASEKDWNVESELKAAREILAASEARGTQDRAFALAAYRVGLLERRAHGQKAAVPPLERALAILEAIGTDEDGLMQASNTLANVYSRLGDQARAEPLFDRALAFLEKSPRANGEDHATVITNMGLLYERKGDSERAEKYLQKGIAMQARIRGNGDYRVLERLGGLGDFYFRHRRFADTLLVGQTIAANARTAGQAYPLGRAYILTGMAYGAQRQLAAAEDFYRAAAKTLDGFHDLRTAYSMRQLADVLTARRQYPEAERWFQRAQLLRERIQGPDSQGVADLQQDLGDMYRQAGRLAEADKALARALELRERVPGLDAGVAAILQSQALLRETEGKPQESIVLRQRAVSVLEKAYGAESTALASELTTLGRLYLAHRNASEAQALASRALTIQEKSLGTEHSALVGTLDVLAAAQENLGRLAAAEATAGRATGIALLRFGPDHLQTAGLEVGWARILVRLRRFAEAAPLAERGLKAVEAKGQPVLSSSYAVNLGNAYAAAREFDKAWPLLDKGIQSLAKALGERHPNVGLLRLQLALAQRQAGRLPDAEANLRRALDILETARGPDHADTLFAAMNLGKVLIEECRYAEAEPLYDRVIAGSGKAWGDSNVLSASARSGSALLLWSHGEFARAETLMRTASESFKAAANRELLFDQQDQLALLEADQRHLDEAIATTLENLSAMETAGLSERIDFLNRTVLLAGLYSLRGDPVRAEALLTALLPKAETMTGPADRRLVNVLRSLAEARLLRKQVDEALSPIKRAVELSIEWGGPEDARLPGLYRVLARALRDKGQLAEAEIVLKRARTLIEKSLGANHPELGYVFAELGNLQSEQYGSSVGVGNMQRARQIIEKAQRNGGIGGLRNMLVCPRMPGEELGADL